MGITERPCLKRHINSARDRLVCHPSGMKNGLSFASRSGGVAFAQPPANFCYPSGIKSNYGWYVPQALRQFVFAHGKHEALLANGLCSAAGSSRQPPVRQREFGVFAISPDSGDTGGSTRNPD
jgi:hypothetical protein